MTAGALFLVQLFVGIARSDIAYFGLLLSVLWAALIFGVIRRIEDAYKAARFAAYVGLVLNAVVIGASLIELGVRADFIVLGVNALKLAYNGVILYLFPQPDIRDWVYYG